MSRRSKPLRFFDFSGGLNTNATVTSLSHNQAVDLQNINLLPSGGFQKRRGNTAFNASALASGAAVHGLGYYRQADQDEWLLAIAGTTFSHSTALNGTFTGATGAVTITTGQNNIWTFSQLNDLAIFVGGAPDAPFRWNGAGDAAALSGTPPSGNFGIAANNRMFIGNTTANPSQIAWSILGNPENWTGTGSGTQDVQKNDGDTLVGAARLGIDSLLLFKQNSIHNLIIRTAPFPLFPLFQNVGAVSKSAILEVDGMIYFITPEPRMKATDGRQIFDFPDYIDSTWNGLNSARLKYIQGMYSKRLRQIWWICSNATSSTNNYCIVWDLERKAWLRHTTGFGMNVGAIAQDRVPYCGAYDGKVYKMDVAGTFTDASEASPGAINSYWKSGWYDVESMILSKHIPYADVNFTNQTTGTMEFGVSYDFATSPSTIAIAMSSPGALWNQGVWNIGIWGGQSDRSKLVFFKGRGKFVQFFIRNQNASENLQFNGFEVPVKPEAPYALR